MFKSVLGRIEKVENINFRLKSVEKVTLKDV
jgi:hypothetical protein